MITRVFHYLRSIQGKLFALLAIMAITLVFGTAVSIRIVNSMHTLSNWRVLSAEIVGLTHLLQISALRISQTKGTPAVTDHLRSLAEDRKDLELTFRKLRGGVAWSGAPKMSDPHLLDALEATEKFWREQVDPAIDMLLLEPADTFNLSETQRLISDFSIAINRSSARMERLLNRRMLGFSSHQWSVFGLNLLVLLITSAVLFITQKRIRQVAWAAQKIHSGQLDSKAEVGGKDEISVFAATFNAMTSKLIKEKITSERIVSSMGEMLVVTSPSGTILSANEATLSICGYTPDELIGRELTFLYDSTEKGIQADSLAAVRKQIEHSGKFTNPDIQLRKKDGELFAASITGTYLPSEKEGSFDLIFVIRDITSFHLLLQESKKRAAAEAAAQSERERAEEIEGLYRQVSELRSQAFEANKLAALGEMASGIAHEINNPMTIICGKAMELRDMSENGALSTERVAKIADQVEQTAFRVARIVKSMRLLSRDGRSERMEPVSVAAIVSDALDLCSEKFRNRGITLEVGQIPSDLLIRCRRVQISQVLINLLNNAHDAVEAETEKIIRIEAAVKDNAVEIRVSDTGPGIPEAIQEKIMQPFFTTKPVGKGTGLGLSISRNIVAGHKGEILLEPVSQGACFVVRLPIAPQHHCPA